MMMQRTLLWSSLLLLILSIWPIIQWVQEEIYLTSMQNDYLLHTLTEDKEKLSQQDLIHFKNYNLTLVSEQANQIQYNYEGKLYTVGDVELLMNGKSLRLLHNWPVYEEKQYLSRYMTGIEMIQVLEKSGDEYLAILIQRTSPFQSPTTAEEFDVIKIYPDGTITEEHVNEENLTWFYTYLGNRLSLEPSGFYTNLPYMNSLFIPYLYPVLPFLYGALTLLVIGFRQLFRNHAVSV